MIILFHKSFGKKYKKLSSKIQKQTDERVHLFRVEPHNSQLNNHPLHGKYSGYWSINVTGNYRALYRFINQNMVEFVDIDTHPNLYE